MWEYIVAEELQRLAVEHNVAARLGIKWERADLADVGRYMGILTASDIIARKVADKNGRLAPSRADYLAALASVCIWPPNKPPVLTSEDQEVLYSTFYSAKLKTALPNAVGPVAIQLPSLINGRTQTEIDAAIKEHVPTNRSQYFQKVLNVGGLR